MRPPLGAARAGRRPRAVGRGQSAGIGGRAEIALQQRPGRLARTEQAKRLEQPGDPEDVVEVDCGGVAQQRGDGVSCFGAPFRAVPEVPQGQGEL
ncbi:hypothetical protein [Actinomadura rubrisoli]|uniref:Uncharacterized protein n=1 Tax=Actinomadura rubrisoli TaxID=2530368 RepID=A0A4R5CBP6_9ACTN|nr:hypothetical protein [Actinomadura rubrisoli]TDD95633.1 hypothetical protein E1298_04455 [Actinomadura rubrisoli]